MSPEFLEFREHGITVIDTGFVRPRFDAAYLIAENGRAAYVDTGTNDALPRLLAALGAQGLEPADVDYLIVTHVHLDHAGAAGALMRHLPRARLVVHPRGARHMIDPGQLLDGARAVYGVDEVARTYGDVLPVDAGRVLETHDDLVLELAGRPLRFIDTPGHARHHHCIWDEVSRGWFTGDTFGSSYREFDNERGAWMFPTTVPTQFDPPALRASVARMLAFAPACMYLTHYGRVGDVPRAAQRLLAVLDAMVAIAERARRLDASERHAAIHRELTTLYRAGLEAHGVKNAGDALALFDMDLDLNSQGLVVWLARLDKRALESHA